MQVFLQAPTLVQVAWQSFEHSSSVHEPAELHVIEQPLPAHFSVAGPELALSTVQLPPGQSNEQTSLLLHVKVHPPPGHVRVHWPEPLVQSHPPGHIPAGNEGALSAGASIEASLLLAPLLLVLPLLVATGPFEDPSLPVGAGDPDDEPFPDAVLRPSVIASEHAVIKIIGTPM